jgi:UDP-GlcNAc:undecaprenyl-phosphate/decaprenyl-phosphate GlcNAc-1-phosphate transferase
MPWLSFALALAATTVSCPIARWLLSKVGRSDLPFGEPAGSAPAFRGGGIAVLTGALVASYFVPIPSMHYLSRVVFAAVLLGLIGFADDVQEIGHATKFAMQVVATAISTALVVSAAPFGGWWRWVVAFPLMLGFVNAFNFMDGINGITSFTTIIIGVTYAIVGASVRSEPIEIGGLIIAGAALGFLPFCFPTAKIFVGDAGTYFIGGWIGGLAVIAIQNGMSPVALLAPWIPYVGDTASTLLRRMARGAAWTHSHREHAYQRLVSLGWSHPRTTALVSGFTAVCSAIGLAFANAPVALQAVAVTACAALVAGYIALPGFIRRRMELGRGDPGAASSGPERDVQPRQMGA